MKTTTLMAAATAVVCLQVWAAEEGLRFHAVFTDHMVLQRDQPVVLKGYARPGAEVCAGIGGAKACARADGRGRWRVALPAMKAGGPYEATASDGERTVTLKDVLVGELWLCSGQSNMEMPVWNTNEAYRLTNGLEVAAAADDPDLRLAQINRTDGAKGPVEEPGSDPRWWKGWQCANTAEAVKPFSATAYFFGKALRKRLGVPVGIVASSWGGTRIDPWIGNPRPPQVFFDGFVQLSNWIARVEQAAGETSADARANWMKADLDTKSWTRSAKFGLAEPEIRWYRWTVELPAAAEDVRFQSDGISDTDETWFDGRKIGATGIDTYCHWSAKRDYPVKGATAGRHVIAVRCFNHMGDGGIASAKLVWKGGTNDLAKTEALVRTEAKPTAKTGLRPWSPWDVPFPRGYYYQPLYYNGMIAPLEGLQFRGVVWYQGCADAGDYVKYGSWQRKLVENWRETFARPDLAFLCVQLAGNLRNTPGKPLTAAEVAALEPSEGGFVGIRAVQEQFRGIPGCDCITAADVGDAHDVHAKDKRTVGERLAAAAENLCYGGKNGVRGPQVKGAVRDGAAAVVTFDGPVVAKGGAIGPQEFTLAGADGKRVWARAKLVAPDKVRVEADGVKKPFQVDYGWNPWTPSMSLANGEGFPAFPFRQGLADADSELIVAVEQKEVRYVVLDPEAKDGFYWQWSPAEDGLVGAWADNFGNPSEAKPKPNGRLLVGACSGAITCLDMRTKKAEFIALARAANLHSCELLPDGRVVAACSDGNSVVLIDVPASPFEPQEQRQKKYSLTQAHGAVWRNGRLYAIGQSHVVEYDYDAKGFDLREVRRFDFTKAGCGMWGHDMLADKDGNLVFTTHEAVGKVEPDTGKIVKLEDREVVKGYASRADGVRIYCIPRESWWTDTLELSDGREVKRPGCRFYKSRWLRCVEK